MIARSTIVTGARRWLGTPFHHQGRLKGVGVDCAGLILGVAAELGIAALDRRGYGRRPDSEELRRLCDEQMRRVALVDAQPGDVLLFEIAGQPQHLGFDTDIGLLHAYAPARRVVEHVLSEDWEQRLVAAFALPGVA